MLAWLHRRRPAAGARAVGLVAAGVAACLVPLIARNLLVGVSPMSLSSVGAVTFILTNAEDWVSLPGVRPLAYAHAADIMGRTGGAFGPVVVETLGTHDGIGSVLGQLWGKFTTSMHWLELPNNTNLYYYSLHAPVLKLMPARFIVVAPLAAVGMVAAWRRFAACWPLYGMAAVGLAPLVAFGNLSRYRLLLLVMLIPFAALAAVLLVRWLAARRFVPAAIALAAIIGLAVFIGRPRSSAWRVASASVSTLHTPTSSASSPAASFARRSRPRASARSASTPRG